MRGTRLKTQRPNISPMQELMGETFGKVGDFWEKFKKINIKFFIGYLLFLYTLPQFLSWATPAASETMLTVVVKICSLFLITLLPFQHFMPIEQLYKKSSDPGYSYVEQFFSYISHSVFHMFVVEIFVSDNNRGNNLLTLIVGIFWCTWSHYRLQGSRRNKLSMDDKNIYWLTWGICIMELIFVIREIIHWWLVATNTGHIATLDAAIDSLAMIVYAVGICLICFQQNKLAWRHVQPFVIILSMHFLIQVLITYSSGVENLILHLNGGKKEKLLPSGMLVMVFINSLFRDIKLRSENAEKKKHQSSSSITAAATSTIGAVIMAGMIVGSLIFYYSQQNIWYFILQYCIILWNLSDIVQFANESKSGAANMMRQMGTYGSLALP